MIRIAVVDDDIHICSHIEKYMNTFAENHTQNIEVEPYNSSESFFHAIKNNNEVYDLIFLDIELDEKTGIDIAEYIRYERQDELQQIVFISGKSGYSLALHDTHPLDFIVKPIHDEQLEKVIVRFLKISGKWSNTFQYNIGSDTIKVKISDIRYFSVQNKDIIIHTVSHDDFFRGSLREIEKELRQYGFLHIHRSYLVNSMYIQIFEYDQVILTDGITTLPIGSSKRTEICRKRIEINKNSKGGRCQ